MRVEVVFSPSHGLQKHRYFEELSLLEVGKIEQNLNLLQKFLRAQKSYESKKMPLCSTFLYNILGNLQRRRPFISGATLFDSFSWSHNESIRPENYHRKNQSKSKINNAWGNFDVQTCFWDCRELLETIRASYKKFQISKS